MTVSASTQTQQTQAIYKTIATKTTSAYENIAPTQKTDKMAEMKEKYKDVYTPIPETYSKADENLQAKKIHEAYPNYISGPDFLKIVDSFYDGKPMELGTKPTQEQIDKQKIAFDKAYKLFGGKEKFTDMMKGSMKIKNDYPVNLWGKDERNSNATEVARFQNAVVYEGLEQGKTVEKAKNYATYLQGNYMHDAINPQTDLLDALVKVGIADSNVTRNNKPQKIDFDASNNSTWDLRKYGIEGEWRTNNIYDDKNSIIAEIEKKIGQFHFMLNNEDLMAQANSKLDASYQTLGQADHYKEYINDKYLPEAKDALNIFKNYKIYDSVDIKA